MSAMREWPNGRMSKARNERMTLEQQIQPLEGKDIPAFFPAMVCPHFAISPICAICPLRMTPAPAIGPNGLAEGWSGSAAGEASAVV